MCMHICVCVCVLLCTPKGNGPYKWARCNLEYMCYRTSSISLPENFSGSPYGISHLKNTIQQRTSPLAYVTNLATRNRSLDESCYWEFHELHRILGPS